MTDTGDFKILDIPGQQKYSPKISEVVNLELPTDMRFVAPVLMLLQSLCNLTDPRAAQEKYLNDLTTALREGCSHLIASMKDHHNLFRIRFSLFTNRIEIQLGWPQEESASEPEDLSFPLHQISAKVDKVDYKLKEGSNSLILVKYFVLPASPI